MYLSKLQLGSVILDIDGNRLDAKFIGSAGVVEDYFTIEKGPVVTTILQNTPTLLEVRDNVPVSGTPQRFIRLQVTRP